MATRRAGRKGTGGGAAPPSRPARKPKPRPNSSPSASSPDPAPSGTLAPAPAAASGNATTTPPAPPPSDDAIERAVEAVNALYAAGALDTALAIADYLVAHLLGGDESQLDRGEDHPVLQRVAAHPRLRCWPSVVWTAAAVRRQVRLLPDAVVRELTLAHHRILLGVPNVRDKVRLAVRAADQDMPTRELAAEVTRWRVRHGMPPLGRPPLDPAIKALRQMRNAGRAAVDAYEEPVRPELSRDEAAPLLREIERLVARLRPLVGGGRGGGKG